MQSFSAHHASLERPQFVRPAAVASASCLVIALANAWPSAVFLAPAAVIGCRYYELACFRTVHRSTLLPLLVLLSTCASFLWTLEHQREGLVVSLELAMNIGWLALTGHLCFVQHRLHQERGLQPAEEAPQWAFGGLLAIMPVIFLVAFVNGLVEWRSSLTLLCGLCGLGVLWLQGRRHILFPRLSMLWLGLWLFADAVGAAAAKPSSTDDDWSDGPLITYAGLLLMAGLLCAYLEFNPRVRRTFVAGGV
ncbi:MAG: hypothetical protein ABIP94_19620 [Planctomycetota bacterium]